MNPHGLARKVVKGNRSSVSEDTGCCGINCNVGWAIVVETQQPVTNKLNNLAFLKIELINTER